MILDKVILLFLVVIITLLFHLSTTTTTNLTEHTEVFSSGNDTLHEVIVNCT